MIKESGEYKNKFTILPAESVFAGRNNEENMEPLKEEKKEYRMPHECPECNWQCFCEEVPCACCFSEDSISSLESENQRLREELKKAQEENEALKNTIAEVHTSIKAQTVTLMKIKSECLNIQQIIKRKEAEIERLKALFPECWSRGEFYGSYHNQTFDEWKKDKGI